MHLDAGQHPAKDLHIGGKAGGCGDQISADLDLVRGGVMSTRRNPRSMPMANSSGLYSPPFSIMMLLEPIPRSLR